MQDGGLRVSLGSNVKSGLMSQSVLPDARNLSQQDIKRGITIIVLSLIKYQGKLYNDNHDDVECIKVALDAAAEMLKDDKAAVWRNPTFFSPRKVDGGEGTVTSKIPNPARPLWS